MIEGYDLPGKTGSGTPETKPTSPLSELAARARNSDIRPLTAWILALALFFTYAALQPGVISRDQIGTLCADTLPLAAVALGEGIVILTAGIDLSVGGILSLGTALAATHFTNASTTLLWSIVILAIGVSAGAFNGLLVGRLRLQPFIVTLATWSIFDGIALQVLPTQGGSVPSGFSNWIDETTAGVPNPVWALIAMAALWLWFKRTRVARRIYAIGSDSEGARIAGVHRPRTLLATYAISGFCAAFAALFYAMLTASGDPTAGDGLILPAVAAAVIGGTSLFGGQGGFIGTIAGALILTLLGDVIFVFNLPSYWTVFADGFLLILAVLVGGGLQTLQALDGPPVRPAAVRSVLERNRAVVLAYVLVIVLAVFGEIVATGFLSVSHVDQLLIEASFIALVAVGQTFVILSGGVDLSIPWVLNASAVLLTIWANGSNAKTLWLFPILLAGGAAVGALNGIGVAFLKIPPIIMTLGMSSMVEGALLLYTNGGSGGNAPTGVVYLATHRWGSIPVVGLVWVGVLIVATVVLSATPFGRRLYATGLNRRVAEFAGVNVRGVTVAVYVISGVAASLAGIVLAGYVGESYLGMGDPYLFASVAAVAIGGASILGGTGNYVGTTAGALVLAVLAAILPILGFTQATLEIVYGCVILIAVSLSSLRLSSKRALD